MILLSTNSNKPAVVDPSQIAAMVEYGDYTRILLKGSSHEVVVAQTIEEIAILITEENMAAEREYKKMARGSVPTTFPSIAGTIPTGKGPIARGSATTAHDIHFYSTDDSSGKAPF